jgi:catechol 2,3-dioxygenase-like lactoylglutathione lyase family enzyme
MRLEHVNLTVSDLERSIDFYSRLLDLGVRWRGHTASGIPAVHVGTDDWYLALFEGQARALPIDYEHTGFNHFD